MSVRLRIRVLRFRQLSTHRLYDGFEHVCNLHTVGLGQKGREAPLRVLELPTRPLGLTDLRSPTGGRKMAESRDERLLAKACSLCQSASGLPILRSREVPLRAPEDCLQPRLGRGPLVFHEGR
jgi:hypothetical protein